MPETDHTSIMPARWPLISEEPPAKPEPSPIPPRCPAKPSRRGVVLATAKLLALGGIAAGATAAAAHAAIGPDAELVRCVDELLAAEERDVELTADLMPGREPPEVMAEAERLRAIWIDRAERVLALWATTPEGVKAKAKFALSLLPQTPDGELWAPGGADYGERIVWSLVHDILGRAWA